MFSSDSVERPSRSRVGRETTIIGIALLSDGACVLCCGRMARCCSRSRRQWAIDKIGGIVDGTGRPSWLLS